MKGGESKDRAWATTGTVIPTTGAPGTHRHHRGSANGQTWKKQHFSSDDIFSTVLGKIDKLNEHYIAFTQYLSMSWWFPQIFMMLSQHKNQDCIKKQISTLGFNQICFWHFLACLARASNGRQGGAEKPSTGNAGAALLLQYPWCSASRAAEWVCTWIFEYLNIWVLEYLSTWIFVYLNIWELEYMSIKYCTWVCSRQYPWCLTINWVAPPNIQVFDPEC